MDFLELIERLSNTLKALARRGKSRVRYEDEEDLFMEMILHLWERWQARELSNKTDSYILQSAYFHLQNHLRTHSEGVELFRLDAPVSLEELALMERLVVPGEVEGPAAEARVVLHGMRNDGLTANERAVVEYLLRGLTAREIGGQMGVSHVMALKWKRGIRHKWENRVHRG